MATLSTDPIDFALDTLTGDLAFTSGKITMTSGVAAVMQGARIRMLTFAGEWFLDLDTGVKWFERDGVPASQVIFGRRFNRARCISELRKAILSTPNVVAITKLSVEFVTASRTLNVLWQAQTEFGDTPVDRLALGK